MSHAWVRPAPVARGGLAAALVARLHDAAAALTARAAARRLERTTARELRRLARTSPHLLEDVGVPADQRGMWPPPS